MVLLPITSLDIYPLSYVNIYGLLLSFDGHFYGQVYRNQELNC